MKNRSFRFAHLLLSLFNQIDLLNSSIFVFFTPNELAVDVLPFGRRHVALFWYVIVDRVLLDWHHCRRCLLHAFEYRQSFVMDDYRMIAGVAFVKRNLHCGRRRREMWRPTLATMSLTM